MSKEAEPKKERKKKEPKIKDPEKKPKRKSVAPEPDLSKKVKDEEEELKAETFGYEQVIEDEDLEAIDEQVEEEGGMDPNFDLVSQMDEVQYNRYVYFKRSSLNRKAIKREMSHLTGFSVTSKMALVMSGITKMYIGEIVEEARSVMSEWGQVGPIQPVHIYEALRRIQNSEKNQNILI